MADECDLAQEIQALHLRIALEGRERSGRGPSLHACEECGDCIPDARRAAIPGVRLCVACQEERDARHH
jgi:phage/conjugal plasmid C-4 type zinc finger TraR family protein